VRLIDVDGKQVGVVSIDEALRSAQDAGVDLVEIAANAVPPVCKVIDFGKFRYDQTKREKEHKKAQHQVKVKEVKLKPNINDHDFDVKLKRARDFLTKGNKVKVTCMFRGREMMHTEVGKKQVIKMCESLQDISTLENDPRLMGRNIIASLAPVGRKKN